MADEEKKVEDEKIEDEEKIEVPFDFEDVATTDIKDQEIKTTTKIVPTAQRHVIQISDINAERTTYHPKSIMKSRELINKPTNSIAIFCNEYIPEHILNSSSIKYYLNINGDQIEVVPINSNKNGIKIVRTFALDVTSDYVHYINETIKSAFLTIVIETSDQFNSPAISSNIKVLIGGSENV